MTENASPFFVRPHRFDDPDPDDTWFPRLDCHRRPILDNGERVLWRGRTWLAGYLLDPDTGTPELAWRLPRLAEITVTDRRLAYVCAELRITAAPNRGAGVGRRRAGPGDARVATGQIRWQWPAELRILPGAGPDPDAGTPRLLVVCDAVGATGRPCLALSGDPSGSVPALRRLATLIRRAVAEFRLANPGLVELAPPEWDILLARAGMASLAETLTDPWRGIDLPGSLPVEFAHRNDYYRRAVPRHPASPPQRASGRSGRWPGSAS